MKNRISWIDIVKGICVLTVVVHHAHFIVSGDYPIWGYNWLNGIIIGFFMSAFFVITGYCSNFNLPCIPFLWKNLKTIIVPCFCLYYLNHWIEEAKSFFFYDADWITWSHFFSPGIRTFIREGGYYWFLIALFLAKMLYYVFNRFIKNPPAIIIVSLFLLLLAVVCAHLDQVPNYFYWQQAMILTPYLPLGVLLKEHGDIIKSKGWVSLSLYVFFISLFVLMGKSIPSVTRTIDISVLTIPVYLFLSLTGTMAIWWLSQIIGKSHLLEYFGKNTLIIYTLNFSVLGLVSTFLFTIYEPQNALTFNLMFWLTIIISIVILSFLSLLLNVKYVRFVLGKF